MSDIVQMTGNVKYTITLDPSVWIFDDRKLPFDQCFNETKKNDNSLEEYTKTVAKQWEKERTEGAALPPVKQSKRRKDVYKILQESYVMPFRPFIDNASPQNDVREVEILQKDGQITKISLSQAKRSLLLFAKKGKPLKEDGPLHLYFGDGSNRENPIKNIIEFHFV